MTGTKELIDGYSKLAAEKAQADVVARALLASLIDVTAMLEHYRSGRASNWDGSTKGQTVSTLRDAEAAIAQARAAGFTVEG